MKRTFVDNFSTKLKTQFTPHPPLHTHTHAIIRSWVGLNADLVWHIHHLCLTFKAITTFYVLFLTDINLSKLNTSPQQFYTFYYVFIRIVKGHDLVHYGYHEQHLWRTGAENKQTENQFSRFIMAQKHLFTSPMARKKRVTEKYR